MSALGQTLPFNPGRPNVRYAPIGDIWIVRNGYLALFDLDQGRCGAPRFSLAQ